MGERSIGVDFASVGVAAVTVSPGSYASGDSAVSAIAFRNPVGDRTDRITVSAGGDVGVEVRFATILVVLITIVVTGVACRYFALPNVTRWNTVGDDAITAAGVTMGRAGEDINFATICVHCVAVSEAPDTTIDFAVSAGTSGDRLGGCTNIVTGAAIGYVDIEVETVVDSHVTIVILVITNFDRALVLRLARVRGAS